MWVNLSATVSAVAAEVGLDPDRNTQDKQNITRWINDTRQEIYNLPVRFAAAEFVSEFAGVANVTAGTVSTVQFQAEVTGLGTTWDNSMDGRYIQIATGQWQRISHVSDSTHLTLESSWNLTGNSGQSYIMWKRYYVLPHKVGHVMTIFDMSNSRFPLAYYDPSEFYLKYGFGDNFNPPLAFTQFSTSELGYAYQYGRVFTSVTATAGSPFIDFPAGSGVVTGISPGDKLLFGDSTTSTAFAVDRVYTDTRVALTELATVTYTSATASAFAMNRVAIQVYPGISNNNTYYYEAYKTCYDLINQSDLIEEGWYPAVKKGAIAKGCGYIRDPREGEKLKEYMAEVQNLIRVQWKAKNPSSRLKPYIPRRYGTGGFFGYFPSRYDIPY